MFALELLIVPQLINTEGKYEYRTQKNFGRIFGFGNRDCCWRCVRTKETAEAVVHKITGDLYRAQNYFHFSVVLNTKDGVIVTNPVNAKFAAWVKAEVKKRFNKPMKYLILSHDHRDHIASGEVFADTATVLAHENT